MNDCLNRLAEIKKQLDLLEEQVCERVRSEESSETAAMDRDRRCVARKLAQLELKSARERLKQYHVS